MIASMIYLNMNIKIFKLFNLLLLFIYLIGCQQERVVEKISDNHFLTDLNPINQLGLKPDVTFSFSHTLKGPFSHPIFFDIYKNYYVILEKKKKKLIFYHKSTKKKKVFSLDTIQMPNRIIQMKNDIFIIEDTYNSEFFKYSYKPVNDTIVFDKKYINKNIYHLSYFKEKFLAINKGSNNSNIVKLNNSLEITEKYVSINAKYITYSCSDQGLIIVDILNYNIYNYNWRGSLKFQVSIKNKKLISNKGIKFLKFLQFPKTKQLTPITAISKIYSDRNPDSVLRIVLQTNLLDEENSQYYYDIFSRGVLISRVPYSFDILRWDYNSFYFLDDIGNIRCLKMKWKKK